ncbi:MAG: ABC transporter permease, partial [Candidatus Sericytochromatia bacterium]|nr:ABC transporter permease [Candidatus Sericytochromatia bacterium]
MQSPSNWGKGNRVILQYILRRLALLIPIVLGVMTLVFLAVQFIPGDPAQVMLGERATPESLTKLRHDMGLDQPLIVQYGRFMSHAVFLDFGRSITSNSPVITEIWAKFPATVELSKRAPPPGGRAGVAPRLLSRPPPG